MDIGSAQAGTAGDYDDGRVGRLDFALTGEVQSVALEPTLRTPVTGEGHADLRGHLVDLLEGQKFYSGMSIEYKITTARPTAA